MLTMADRCTRTNRAGSSLLGEIVERGAIQALLAADVQGHVDAGPFDPVDVVGFHEARGPTGLDDESVEPTFPSGRAETLAASAPRTRACCERPAAT